MKKTLWMILSALLLTVLVACGDEATQDELQLLEVDFEVPEAVDVGETVELKAHVTYGDEKVTDADEVVFEVWEKGNRENGDMLDAINHEDGTYTIEVTFDHDGIFEMYAHTTARELHTMPKKEIVVGEGGDYDNVDGDLGFQTEGFDLHFMDPEEPKVGEAVDLIVHVLMDEDAFENATVRYEIWNDNMSEDRDWMDADETTAGEYLTTYTFEEAGTYHIHVHVEDDNGLQEHAVYEININE